MGVANDRDRKCLFWMLWLASIRKRMAAIITTTHSFLFDNMTGRTMNGWQQERRCWWCWAVNQLLNLCQHSWRVSSGHLPLSCHLSTLFHLHAATLLSYWWRQDLLSHLGQTETHNDISFIKNKLIKWKFKFTKNSHLIILHITVHTELYLCACKHLTSYCSGRLLALT